MSNVNFPAMSNQNYVSSMVRHQILYALLSLVSFFPFFISHQYIMTIFWWVYPINFIVKLYKILMSTIHFFLSIQSCDESCCSCIGILNKKCHIYWTFCKCIQWIKLKKTLDMRKCKKMPSAKNCLKKIVRYFNMHNITNRQTFYFGSPSDFFILWE